MRISNLQTMAVVIPLILVLSSCDLSSRCIPLIGDMGTTANILKPPENLTVNTGEQVFFEATGACSGVDWSASGGEITPKGRVGTVFKAIYTAPQESGDYEVIASSGMSPDSRLISVVKP